MTEDKFACSPNRFSFKVDSVWTTRRMNRNCLQADSFKSQLCELNTFAPIICMDKDLHAADTNMHEHTREPFSWRPTARFPYHMDTWGPPTTWEPPPIWEPPYHMGTPHQMDLLKHVHLVLGPPPTTRTYSSLLTSEPLTGEQTNKQTDMTENITF